MSDILDKILAVKADEIRTAKKQRDLASLRRDVETDADAKAALRNFEAGLRNKVSAGSAAVIAEVKKASWFERFEKSSSTFGELQLCE